MSGSESSSVALIGIDWGSTNLRAYRFDGSGAVVASRESAQGIVNIRDRGFEAALLAICADWIDAAPDTVILLSGMIGSRQGWIEAPYAPCPASSRDVARQLARIDMSVAHAWIVPGISVVAESGVYDVMRGEETQIFGAIDSTAPAFAIAPGTHSKWIDVENGVIRNFRTFMTGELYSLLRSHSLLGRLMIDAAHDADAFSRGVRIGLEGDLAGHLFGVRTEGLFARIAPAALASYLSGLLIGAEIHSATRGPSRWVELQKTSTLRIIGTAAISGSYRDALAQAGMKNVELVDAHRATARGLWNIATQSTQLREPT
jgi:2-dehydro-3-deoxygalactonokinase